jgi:hypothetical protein
VVVVTALMAAKVGERACVWVGGWVGREVASSI